MNNTVIQGYELGKIVPDSAKKREPGVGSINITYSGKNGCGESDSFVLNQTLLSQHLLVLGGIGSGKTNSLQITLNALTGKHTAPNTLGTHDVMVIFDTKGDFKDQFYRPGDIIFSNRGDACGADGKADFWNIINELKNDEHLRENIIEISHALFSERLKNSKEAFFPMAAREVMGAILYHAVQKRRTEPRSVNNAFILQMINKSAAELRGIFDKYPPYKYVNCFIPEEAVEQTEGVMAELLSVVQPLLVGNFGKPGSLSIRDLIKAKGGRRIFIEYDIGVGNMLTPIYTLLFDLAIKEALCRDHSEGNVFMIADEFKLLPNLRHIDDAVNFGRSLGLKFMIGIQNVDQIIEIYGESRAKNIFSGFMSHFAFPVSDYNTRKYIKERAGENITCTEAYGHEVYRHISKANVVEDWDMAELVQGECIVMLNHQQPFNFKFEKYEPARKR